MPGKWQAGEMQNAESPVEIIQYNELQLKIAKILERLPERCGQIFCMNRFEGFEIYRNSR